MKAKRIDWVPHHLTGNQLEQHLNAIQLPRGIETPTVMMLRGWLRYQEEYRARFGDGVGTDGILGPAWRDAGKAIHALLDGPTGRLDCGTLSSIINSRLWEEGLEK